MSHTQQRLSGRIKLLVQEHLTLEEDLLARVSALTSEVTAGGVRSSAGPVQIGLAELARDLANVKSQRETLRREVAQALRTTPERVRISRLQFGNPAETEEFHARCAELRTRTIRTAARVNITSGTLSAWQRLLVTLLAQATGSEIASDRYSAAGRKIISEPAIRVKMRS